jgi:WD40 repeat protein
LAQGHDKDRADKFVLSVAYSADGKRIAAGAMDGTVAVFDVESVRLLHVLEGHKMPVRTLAFSPDSKTLLTGCVPSRQPLDVVTRIRRVRRATYTRCREVPEAAQHR